MNPVRPNPFAAAPQAQPARPIDPARAAAQRAFFEAALGKAAAPSAAPAQAHSQAAPAPPRTPEVGAPKPEKILRPGSLLDIRV